MAAGHGSRSYVNNPVSVPSNTTAQYVCNFGINNGMRLNLGVDIVLGQCSVAGATTVKLQTSNGLGLWTDSKTASPTSSTDKTISAVTAGTGTLTSNSHGYAAGQLVTINSAGGTVPGGLIPGGRYFVSNPTTNTFQLSTTFAGAGVSAPAISSFGDAGSGTITTSAAQVITIAVNSQTSGDVQYLPLRPQGQLVCTTANGDTVQIIDVRVGHIY